MRCATGGRTLTKHIPTPRKCAALIALAGLWIIAVATLHNWRPRVATLFVMLPASLVLLLVATFQSGSFKLINEAFFYSLAVTLFLGLLAFSIETSVALLGYRGGVGLSCGVSFFLFLAFVTAIYSWYSN